MMVNWWPVTASRLEDPEYQPLTSTERLYLEYIIGEFRLRGPFYKSDLEVAVILGISEDKVRRARRGVGRPTASDVARAKGFTGRSLSSGLGWVVYSPGWKNDETVMATRYVGFAGTSRVSR